MELWCRVIILEGFSCNYLYLLHLAELFALLLLHFWGILKVGARSGRLALPSSLHICYICSTYFTLSLLFRSIIDRISRTGWGSSVSVLSDGTVSFWQQMSFVSQVCSPNPNQQSQQWNRCFSEYTIFYTRFILFNRRQIGQNLSKWTRQLHKSWLILRHYIRKIELCWHFSVSHVFWNFVSLLLLLALFLVIHQ